MNVPNPPVPSLSSDNLSIALEEGGNQPEDREVTLLSLTSSELGNVIVY